MKKLLTIAALVGMASLSYGQGYVSFGATTGTRITTNSVALGGTSGFTSGAANGYYYALLVAPSTTTTIGNTFAGWTFTGDIAINSTAVGKFSDAGVTDGTSVAVPGYAAGATASFAVVGFSANLVGSPLAANVTDQAAGNQVIWTDITDFITGGAAADPGASGSVGFYGISSVGTGIPLNPAGSAADVMGVSPAIGGFALTGYLIPEPCTFALCGLGAAALVIFRRRN
jgi:hypothetical protein